MCKDISPSQTPYQQCGWEFIVIETLYSLLAEDGDGIESCILATLRKLQDGYFGGARSQQLMDIKS